MCRRIVWTFPFQELKYPHDEGGQAGTVGGAGQNAGMQTLAWAEPTWAELAWAELATPVGPVAVGCSDAGVARVRFGPPPAAPGPGAVAGEAGPPGEGGPARGAAGERSPRAREDLARRARQELAEYLAGERRAFGLPLDWDGVPERNRQVLGTLLQSAGYGQTITYGELARRSGLADVELPARVAGQIMGTNRLPLLVPCHRVVASDGIGGYSGGTGIEAKRWLLILEGVLPPTLDWAPALAG